jgi:7,8-dihydro-6-hydroxymethylpterin dimethyltransferase
MAELIAQTESLCPHCLRRIAARKVNEQGSIYLKKSCPTHGDLPSTLLWRETPRAYLEWNRFSGKTRKTPALYPSRTEKGCPYDCGLCAAHCQDTCTVILELTEACNLRCPVCFAASGSASSPTLDQDQIAQRLEKILDYGGPRPIQFSGGEPTLRDDLPQIVALAKRLGFDHIQINTNGIRLANEPAYGQSLKTAGATVIFLQFDAVTEDVYRKIRGADLLQTKMRAVAVCADLHIGVILVPTLVKGLNDNQIGKIIQYAKEWIPTVKGVHFQPVTYVGRYPSQPRNEDRILIPDILAAIEEQTGGELKVENLVPPG